MFWLGLNNSFGFHLFLSSVTNVFRKRFRDFEIWCYFCREISQIFNIILSSQFRQTNFGDTYGNTKHTI